jgi:hypothetical protein
MRRQTPSWNRGGNDGVARELCNSALSFSSLGLKFSGFMTRPGGGFLTAARIIPDLLRGSNGATGHWSARVIGALANHFRSARHVADATGGRTFAHAFKGDGLDLIIDGAWRNRNETGSREVRIGVYAGYNFGLVIRAARGKERIGSEDVNAGHGGHAKGDE